MGSLSPIRRVLNKSCRLIPSHLTLIPHLLVPPLRVHVDEDGGCEWRVDRCCAQDLRRHRGSVPTRPGCSHQNHRAISRGLPPRLVRIQSTDGNDVCSCLLEKNVLVAHAHHKPYIRYWCPRRFRDWVSYIPGCWTDAIFRMHALHSGELCAVATEMCWQRWTLKEFHSGLCPVSALLDMATRSSADLHSLILVSLLIMIVEDLPIRGIFR